MHSAASGKDNALEAPLRIAILDDYQHLFARLAEPRRLDGRAQIDVFDRNLSLDEAKRELQPYDALCVMRERMALPADLIDSLPNLKLIAITGKHNRTLDLDAAKRRGIVVCFSAGVAAPGASTAELAWGLLLAVARHIPAEHALVRAGGWQGAAGLTLAGRTLGIAGFGRIGQQIARYGLAFGMKVQAWSPHLTSERVAGSGVEAVDKAELFASSDAVSLHLVLGDSTLGVVGADDFARMKPGAILINTARAGLVDQPAMIAALDAGHIFAGLDVFPEEPLDPDSDYRHLPNCVLTPHLGYVTVETMTAFHQGTVEVIEAWLDGAPIRRIA